MPYFMMSSVHKIFTAITQRRAKKLKGSRESLLSFDVLSAKMKYKGNFVCLMLAFRALRYLEVFEGPAKQIEPRGSF